MLIENIENTSKTELKNTQNWLFSNKLSMNVSRINFTKGKKIERKDNSKCIVSTHKEFISKTFTNNAGIRL